MVITREVDIAKCEAALVERNANPKLAKDEALVAQ